MLIAVIILAFPFLNLSAPLNLGKLDSSIHQANEDLQKGEQATDYDERKKALNRALFLYNQAEQQSNSPELTRVIGDIYLQLGEYPFAALYYQRTLKSEPSNRTVMERLEKVLQKLGVAHVESKPKSPIKQFLAFIALQDFIYVWSILLTLFTLSLCIWFSYPFIRKAALSISLLTLLLLINFMVFYYSTPLEGVLIASTGFYRAPGDNQPQLTALPLQAGSKVNLLQATKDGDWIKIETVGLVGYVHAASVRVI